MSASIWSPDGTIPSEAPPDYIYKRIWIDIAAGQTLVNFASVDPTFVYTPGLQSLEVGIDGEMPLQPVVDYTETSASSITLVSAPTDAGRLYAAVGRPIQVSPSGVTAALVPYTFPNGVVRSVQDLATYLGTTGIGTLIPGTGGLTLTSQDIVEREIYADGYASLQQALNFASLMGGARVICNKRYLITSNLTVPKKCSLVGPWLQPGELLPGTIADYDALQGSLIVSSSATIKIDDCSGIKGLLIIREGLNLPFADATAATAGVAAFAGTAINVQGSDVYLGHLLILGFNKAVFMENNIGFNYERLRCEYVTGDCTNGLDIQDCYDKSYYLGCHFWPWTTVHQSWTTNALLRRTGTAYKVVSSDDWASFTTCFSYGYFRGFDVVDCNSVTFLVCGADNTSTAAIGDHIQARGFSVNGACVDTQFLGCQSAAQYSGFYVNVTSANSHTKISNCVTWAAAENGVRIDVGDTSIDGNTIRNTSNGVLVNSTTAKIFIDNNRFSGLTSKPVGFNVASSSTFIGDNNDYGDLAAGVTIIAAPGNYLGQSAVAAAALVTPANINGLLTVTGNTNISTIPGGWLNRKITIVFTGTPTVVHGVGADAIVMKGFVNRVMAAGSTLEAIHNGTQWYEI